MTGSRPRWRGGQAVMAGVEAVKGGEVEGLEVGGRGSFGGKALVCMEGL
jgi:hypothetical protein